MANEKIICTFVFVFDKPLKFEGSHLKRWQKKM